MLLAKSWALSSPCHCAKTTLANAIKTRFFTVEPASNSRVHALIARTLGSTWQLFSAKSIPHEYNFTFLLIWILSQVLFQAIARDEYAGSPRDV